MTTAETPECTAPITKYGAKIKVNALFETSVNNVWAGGDCVSAGDDLTVTAVAQGRDAAENIHSKLMGEA